MIDRRRFLISRLRRRVCLHDERGFALLAVMLILALFGAIVAEFAFSMRLEATMARHFKDEIQAAHLAEAGIQQAIREILGSTLYAVDKDGQLVFYKTVTEPLPLARKEVTLGPGQFSYRISDEDAKINLNNVQQPVLERLLFTLGIEKQERDVIIDSIQDWTDPNELHRGNGAESDDHYLTLLVPYRSKNGSFDSVTELLQVKGITREIFEGTNEHQGLAEFVTTAGSGQVNGNTASSTVLKALGIGEAQITLIEQDRVKGPLDPGKLAQLGVTGLSLQSSQSQSQTQTFLVESLGLLRGQPRYRVVALIQKKSEGGTPKAVILSWSQKPPVGPLP